MDEETKVQLLNLKSMAEDEKDPGIRMSIYEAMASYGIAATKHLLELAKSEADAHAKQCALSMIKEANSRKS